MHALLALTLAAAAPGSPPTPLSDSPAEAIERYLERLEGVGFSGVCLVARGDQVLVARGSGLADPVRGVPNDVDTVVPLGSITKHFTAALVLRLASEGALVLDDTLERFLDDVPPDKRAITLRHLLAHASGLPESIGGLEGLEDPAALARAILAAELLFAPGKGVSYSGIGYSLLALVAAHAAGEPFEQALRRRVLLPAGMRHAGFAAADFGDAVQSRGIVDGRDEGTLLESHGGRVSLHLQGRGGLQGSARDLFAWSRALRAHAVLDEAAFAEMVTPRGRLGPEVEQGYGCGIRSGALGRALEHSGSDDVFMAWIRHGLDDERFVFVASNDAELYASVALRGVERLLAGEPAPEVPETIRLAPERLRAYEGLWGQGGETVRVEALPGGLALSSDTFEAAALLHPLPAAQRERRELLARELEAAASAAFAGDAGRLHALLDPFAPFEAFAADTGGFLDDLVARHGPFASARALPGRNRFGEIALVLELGFEQGVARVEYSFGAREVGSIRFLEAWPRRIVHPQSPERFLAYQGEDVAPWSAGFALGTDGAPRALVLSAPGGEPVSFERAR